MSYAVCRMQKVKSELACLQVDSRGSPGTELEFLKTKGPRDTPIFIG